MRWQKHARKSRKVFEEQHTVSFGFLLVSSVSVVSLRRYATTLWPPLRALSTVRKPLLPLAPKTRIFIGGDIFIGPKKRISVAKKRYLWILNGSAIGISRDRLVEHRPQDIDYK